MKSSKPDQESNKINRLILVGNGFDLAHGMKTSYSDFILWYFQKCWEAAKKTYTRNPKFHEENYYSNELINISYNHELIFFINPLDKKELIDLNDVKLLITPHSVSDQRKQVNLTYNSEFFKSIVDDVCYKNWVDIENHYYQQLTHIIKRQTALQNQSEQSYINSITNLNNDFDVIKKQLEVYLSHLDCVSNDKEIMQDMYEIPVVKDSEKSKQFDLGKVFVLNFNYTQTTNNYKRSNTDIIHIHGELNNDSNPIIFGYGDERDETYDVLEKANINEVFTHIKSFDYLKTNNYSLLLAFLESEYDVYIMGHSCGLSDRTLLSTIFEHKNCRLIKIFYHDNADRYRKTTYEISRHFKDKAEMRKKVLDFTKCKPLPQSNQ